MTLEQARKILNSARDGQDIPRSEIDRALAVTDGAEMERRKAEHDAAMADAARFRWLDEVALSVDMVADPDNLVQVWHETLSGHATTGRTLREAVDEAMKRHNGSLSDGMPLPAAPNV